MGCGASAKGPDPDSTNVTKNSGPSASKDALPAGSAPDLKAKADDEKSQPPKAVSSDAPKAETDAPFAAVSGSAKDASSPPVGDANAPWGPPKPCLHYFPFAGRGELSRLIAAAGGLVIDEKNELKKKGRSAFGSPGQWPCLDHDELKIAQSFCIESYLATIAPNFKDLTMAQRAVDAMFCKIKEDILAGYTECLSVIVADESQKADQCADLAMLSDKWFPVLQDKLPADGFVNGLAFPTVADLAVLNVARAFMPFGAAYFMSECDLSQNYPKIVAHVDRVAAHPAVKAYLDKSTTMDADPMGFKAKWEASFTLYQRKNFKGARQAEDMARDLFGTRL